MSLTFVKKSSDLETRKIDVCTGFLDQAIQKTEKAEPYIKRAGEFREALEKTNKIEDLMSLTDFREELISACGFSDKARSKFTKTNLNKAIETVLKKLKETSENGFREEILYRYLLTKGDALGGSLRNYTGAIAGIKLVAKVKEKLSQSGFEIGFRENKSGKTQCIFWKNRVLFFDVKPKIINKNIDVILVAAPDEGTSEKKLIEDETLYIACGELKGGIDPAGADEHWKTANSSLGRIRTAFQDKKNKPALFFIGAAIEKSMAKEIFNQIKNGQLTYAANLNKEEQFNDLVEWLISL